MIIKSNLKTIMDKEGLSPYKLSELTGASRPAIKDLYNNTASLFSKHTLELLCKYFKCSVSDLLEIVQDKETA